MRDRSHIVRRVLLGSVLMALPGLLSCENPDFSGVRFRPQFERPDAYKTAIKGYLFRRQDHAIVWGNEFLHHARSLREREFTPEARVRVVLDEVRESITDPSGMFAFQGLEPGFHSIKFRDRGSNYESPVHVNKDHLTLVAMEISGKDLLVSEHGFPHSFLTNPALKELLGFHSQALSVVKSYHRARRERSRQRWEELLAEEYSDPQGGREDFIRAVSTKEAAKLARLKPRSFRSVLEQKKAKITLRVSDGRVTGFERLDLVEDPKAGDGWRVLAVYD